jgi:UDP-perosamine 4-acetyltransferase
MHPVAREDLVDTIVVGAHGHARVCLEALQDPTTDPALRVVGAVSLDGTGASGLGTPMLGRDADLRAIAREHGVSTVFVAIGDNRARAAVTERLLLDGFRLATAVSRFAMVSRSAQVADGAALLPGAVVNAATRIGRGTIVNTNASVDHDCEIGAFVHIAPGTAIAGGVTIGDGALLGIGSRVLPGVTIGNGAVVGAGAVVVRDIPPCTVVVGVPARVLETAAPATAVRP